MYAPVEKLPDALVVATTVERFETVPYAKPRVVGVAPPVALMVPLAVAVVCVTDDAADVVTVGAVAQALVVNEDDIAPYPVPAELVANARV